MISQPKDGIILLDWAVVQPHLKSCVWCWTPDFKKDVKVPEYIQRSRTKLVEELEGTSCEDSEFDWLGEKEAEESTAAPYSFLTREVVMEVLIIFPWDLEIR